MCEMSGRRSLKCLFVLPLNVLGDSGVARGLNPADLAVPEVLRSFPPGSGEGLLLLGPFSLCLGPLEKNRDVVLP